MRGNVYTFIMATLLTVITARADFATINIDGDFSDWASVSILATDPVDAPGSVDFTSLQMANDDANLYVRFDLAVAANPHANGVWFVIDTDQNASTGFSFDGVLGSEALWFNTGSQGQNNDVWNDGPLGDATYTALPYNTSGTSFEFSVPLTAFKTSNGDPVFPPAGESFDFRLRAEGGAFDGFAVTSYTIAAIPEPSSLALGLIGLACTFMCIRKRG